MATADSAGRVADLRPRDAAAAVGTALASRPLGLRDARYGALMYDAVHNRRHDHPPLSPLALIAYRYIWTGIADRDLPPGSALTEAQLADHLGMSRVPVRAALSHLHAQGVLVRQGRSLRVPTFRRNDLMDLYQYRLAIESRAAVLATTRVREDELRRLQAATERLAVRLSASFSDIDAAVSWMLADVDLHAALIVASDNPYLRNAWTPLQGRLLLFQIQGFRSPDNVLCSLREHLRILTALSRRDSSSVRSAVETHIDNVMERTLSFLTEGD